MLSITAGNYNFRARLEYDAAPLTVGITDGIEKLRSLGKSLLWDGAREISFTEAGP